MIMSMDTPTWQQLGQMLIQRRTALDPRFHNRQAFADATGLKYRLVYDIEEARRTNFGGPTLAAIEVAYKLEPGSIDRALQGGSLESADGAGEGITLPLPDMSPAFESAFSLERQALTARANAAEQAEAEIARVEHRPPRRLTGADYFPLNKPDQGSWDNLAGRGLSRRSVIDILSVVHVYQQDRDEQDSGHAAGLRPFRSQAP